MSDDEKAVIDLMRSLFDEVATEDEDVDIDPKPGVFAGEQYHVYYHCGKSKYATMVGWFRVDGKFLVVTTFKDFKTMTEAYDPGADTTKLVMRKIDVSDPALSSLKEVLRGEFNKARTYLEAESGE